MAGKGNIGAKIVLEGEKQYREALKGIKTEQAELRSEMKLSQTTFKDNQNSVEALRQKYDILSRQCASQTEKTKIYEKAISDYSEKQEKAGKKIEELQAAVQKAKAELENMSDSTDDASEAVQKQKKHIEDLQKQLSDAEKNYISAGQKIDSYQTSLNYARVDLAAMEKELEKAERYMKEAESSTDGMAKSIDKLGAEVKETKEETAVLGDVLKANLLSEAVISGVKALAGGVEQMVASAIDAGSSFEASMSQVAATMGMTAEEIANGSEKYNLLSEAAKKCGKETMFSAAEAAEALNYLALAGYDAQKAATALPKVLDLAAAGGLDLAYASDLVTDSMAALGMEISELDNYIDQMAKTSQKSNTSVAQLGEATLVCAGTVELAGQSLETMNAELGVLANNNIKGAEGGTHLRNIILSLAAPTETASEAIKQLRVNIADSHGNMRDLNDIMIDLNAAMDGMSSTKKTQIISQIFNTTDIAAVNALLKGTGDEYNNLYEEITNCSGAAANMAETLNNNLKGKVTILQAALEGLGISAYEIFDDNIKEAMDSATEAIGSLQKAVDEGDLGISLNKMSKSMGEFVENAINVAEDALPLLIEGLAWVLDNADLIISGITGIGAAIIEMKVVAPAVEAVTAVWRTYKAANEGATVSQWLLNTAMNANPAGLLVTGIVGLTTALVTFAAIQGFANDAIDESIEKTKELNETHKQNAASWAENREGMDQEAAVCKNLVTELNKLQSKTSLTADEQARQKMIVDQLNQAMPELNLSIDEQTGKLNKSSEALEDNVEAMMALAKAEAAQEDLLKIADEQYEAEKNLLELEKQLEEQKRAVANAQNDLNTAFSEYDAYIKNYNYGKSLSDLESLENQIADTKQGIADLSNEYQNTINYISDTTAIAEAALAASELGNSASVVSEEFAYMSGSLEEALASMQTNITDSVTSSMSIFDQYVAKTAISKEQLLANMESQLEGMQNWADNMAILADSAISQGLMEKLAEMGPEGAAYVQAFVKMSEDELKKANDLYAQSLMLPTELSDQIVSAYQESGAMITEGLASGIEENAEMVTESLDQVGEDGIVTMNKKWGMNSPSRVAKEMGMYFDEGLSLGIEENKEPVLLMVSNLGGEVVQTLESRL